MTNIDTLGSDILSRRISGEDNSLFQQSRTNLSLLGRRGVPTLSKFTTPSATFPEIPTIEGRFALRRTLFNISRFRDKTSQIIEENILSRIRNFRNSDNLASELVKKRRQDLFTDDIRNRISGASLSDQISSATQEIAKNIRFKEGTAIDRLQAMAINARQNRRMKLLNERDISAKEGTIGGTPRTFDIRTGNILNQSI